MTNELKAALSCFLGRVRPRNTFPYHRELWRHLNFKIPLAALTLRKDLYETAFDRAKLVEEAVHGHCHPAT